MPSTSSIFFTVEAIAKGIRPRVMPTSPRATFWDPLRFPSLLGAPNDPNPSTLGGSEQSDFTPAVRRCRLPKRVSRKHPQRGETRQHPWLQEP